LIKKDEDSIKNKKKIVEKDTRRQQRLIDTNGKREISRMIGCKEE